MQEIPPYPCYVFVMNEILYPGYRSYVRARVEVNDAMTALLAGARLASHTLELTRGSTHTLKEVFPAVEHIERFNLRSDAARDFLLNADHHLASVAIPYALATHEDYVMGVLDLLESHGRPLITQGKRVRAWNMHAVLFSTCGVSLPGKWIETFDVLREVRNCITHSGGVKDDKLQHAFDVMSPEAREGWKKVNLLCEPESLVVDGRIVLTPESIFTAFAVTKRLGREINAALAGELRPEEWAKIVVLDYSSDSSKTKNSTSWRRSLLGFAGQNYGALGLAESDLEQAARDCGKWTLPQWR